MIKRIFNKIAGFRSRPLVWDTFTTTFFSVVGKSLGFLIPLFIAGWFGVSSETDAFFFSYTIILIVSSVFSPALEQVTIPFITEAREKNEPVGDFVGQALVVGSIGVFFLAGVILLFSKPLLPVLTNFNAISLRLIHVLLLETVPLAMLMIWSSTLAGALNAYQKFTFPALSPGFRAIMILLVIFFFKDKFGVHAIAMGYILGEITRVLILFGIIKSLGLFKVRFSFRLDERLHDFLKSASYQTAGTVVVGLTPLINRSMSSWLAEGSVSILYYAERLYAIPTTLMSSGLMVTLLSHWSRKIYVSKVKDFKKEVMEKVKMVGLISLPLVLLLILLHKPLVKLAYGRGDFTPNNLNTVALVLTCFLVGMLPYLMALVLFQAHLAMKNTKILMQSGFYRCLFVFFFNYVFLGLFGINGIALSNSVVSVFFLWFLVRRL